MPKKGGKGKKKKGQKGDKGPKLPKPKKVADGLSPSEMTAGQLMAQIKRLQAERDRENEEMQMFMLERKKLYMLWNLALDKYKIIKDEANNSQTLLRQTLKDKEAEEELQNKKLRHLQNEATKNLGTIRLHHLNYMKNLSDEIWEIENILRESAVGKRSKVRFALGAQYEVLRGLHAKHMQSLSEMRMVFSSSTQDHSKIHDSKFESRNETAIAETNAKQTILIDHKTELLESMYARHDRVVQELQTYFQDMTLNNFAVMHSLHEEIETLRMTNSRLNRGLKAAKESYSSVNEPLQKLMDDMKTMSAASNTDDYELSLEKGKQLHMQLKEKQCAAAQEEMLIEILIQQTSIAKKEVDKLRQKFSKGIFKMQSQISMGTLVNRLKAQTAQKDAIFLRAIHSYKSTGDVGQMRTLHHQMDIQQRNIRQQVEKSKKGTLRSPNCYDPRVVQDEMRESVFGLQNKQGCIPVKEPEMPKWLKQFQGRGQDFQTRIRYEGNLEGQQHSPGLQRQQHKKLKPDHHHHHHHSHLAKQGKGQNPCGKMDSSRSASRKHDVGYGYYLIDPKPFGEVDSEESTDADAFFGSKHHLKLPALLTRSHSLHGQGKPARVTMDSAFSPYAFDCSGPKCPNFAIQKLLPRLSGSTLQLKSSSESLNKLDKHSNSVKALSLVPSRRSRHTRTSDSSHLPQGSDEAVSGEDFPDWKPVSNSTSLSFDSGHSVEVHSRA